MKPFWRTCWYVSWSTKGLYCWLCKQWCTCIVLCQLYMYNNRVPYLIFYFVAVILSFLHMSNSQIQHALIYVCRKLANNKLAHYKPLFVQLASLMFWHAKHISVQTKTTNTHVMIMTIVCVKLKLRHLLNGTRTRIHSTQYIPVFIAIRNNIFLHLYQYTYLELNRVCI